MKKFDLIILCLSVVLLVFTLFGVQYIKGRIDNSFITSSAKTVDGREQLINKLETTNLKATKQDFIKFLKQSQKVDKSLIALLKSINELLGSVMYALVGISIFLLTIIFPLNKRKKGKIDDR